jgi:ATP-dependent helicase/nuclease subunit B
LERQVRARYGSNLALPLVIQLESARQRLSKAAGVEAAERLAGWVCEQVERKFTLEISGLVVSGKIDRIDRHTETGVVRVLDYKTSDVRATPPEAHLRSLRPGETPPEWAVFSGWGRPRVWSDLQLPLYRQALAAEFPGGVTCGYFNLPKAAGETGIAVWHEYTRELETSAGRCADAACAAIRAGRFWPPNETVRPKFDDFASLFHHGVADSVAWEEKS